MNKQEFLNTLRIIFKKANVLDVKSIIDVYEEHFAVGYEKGLNDVTNHQITRYSKRNLYILCRGRYHH